jgi:hypothetical protein
MTRTASVEALSDLFTSPRPATTAFIDGDHARPVTYTAGSTF